MKAFTASTTPDDEKDLAATPPDDFEHFQKLTGIKFVHDVCALPHSAKVPGSFWSPDDDALSLGPWAHHFPELSPLWMNPPYSKPEPWIKKANEAAKHGLIVVGLLPLNTSAGWYLDHVKDQASVIWLPDRRIRFVRPDGSVMDRPFQSSMFVMWTPWRTGQTTVVHFNLKPLKEPKVMANDEQIEQEMLRLCTVMAESDDKKEQRDAFDRIQKLHAQRSPERIAEMEKVQRLV